MTARQRSLRSCEEMRPQSGVDRLKPVPPLHANDWPEVGQPPGVDMICGIRLRLVHPSEARTALLAFEALL